MRTFPQHRDPPPHAEPFSILSDRELTTVIRCPRLLFVPLALCVLTAGLALSGCSGSRSATGPGAVPSAFPNHSPDQIRTRIRASADTLERYKANARVSVRTPKNSRSFNANIRQERGDSLLMRFSLFGMEGGRLLMTRDSVFFYNVRENSLRVGPLADARMLFPGPVTSDRIFSNMLGLISPRASNDWSVEADESLYYLSDPTERRHWVVDPRRWRVIRFTKESKDGTVVEKRHFSKFQKVGGVVLPHQVIFRRPSQDLMGRIRYENIHLNPKKLSFDLGVPSNIPRRPLR